MTIDRGRGHSYGTGEVDGKPWTAWHCPEGECKGEIWYVKADAWTREQWHIGEFAGIPPTGKEIRVPICVVYDLEHDQIKRARVYLELPVLLRQLGATAPVVEPQPFA
jgi:hypothetical protein